MYKGLVLVCENLLKQSSREWQKEWYPRQKISRNFKNGHTFLRFIFGLSMTLDTPKMNAAFEGAEMSFKVKDGLRDIASREPRPAEKPDAGFTRSSRRTPPIL